MTQQAQYSGARILEAMHEAVRYTEAIYEIIKRTKPPHGQAILEFGAGDGAFIGKFADEGIYVHAVEKDAKLRAELQNRNVRFVREDIRLVESESFDFVYTVNVLEHIEDLEAELREIHRVLRRDGTIFVFVPAFEMLWTSLDDEVGHVRRFTKLSLCDALQKAGFTVARVEYFDCLGFPAALLVRLLETLGMFRYQPESVRFYDRYIFPISRSLDRILHQVFGKNLVAVARKP